MTISRSERRTLPVIGRHAGLAASLVLMACTPEDPTADARRLALGFCRAMEADEELSAEAMMSAALQAAIARARAADTAFRAARPGDKPPLGDGLRLTAFPDAIEDCAPTVEGPSSVEVAYRPKGSPAGGWQDRLLLARGPGNRLVIADIVYGDGKQRFSGWLTDAAVP